MKEIRHLAESKTNPKRSQFKPKQTQFKAKQSQYEANLPPAQGWGLNGIQKNPQKAIF